MKYLFLFCLLFLGCARTKLARVDEAMRPVTKQIGITDSLSPESFFLTLKKHINVMKTSHQINDPMIFGKRKISKVSYISALEKILEHEDDYLEWIEKNFELYEVYGRSTWGEVLTTGYYEPEVSGAREKTAVYSRPIYSTPNDLITVDLKLFENEFKRYDFPAQLSGRLKDRTLIPYFDRKEIDIEKKLHGQNLELAWVDPTDAFFIQIQGSGVIKFNDREKIRVGYASQNGHPYKAIGKFLTDVIPMKEMSLQKIKAHLLTLSPEKQQDIFNQNPSYVFFKILNSEALTYAGMEVSEGRTMATDNTFFPKGALAFLDIDEPVFETISDTKPTSWKHMPRLVFDQDTGGAIRGGDRVDLFFGKGEMAFQKAGVMKNIGRLYYLLPKIQ